MGSIPLWRRAIRVYRTKGALVLSVKLLNFARREAVAIAYALYWWIAYGVDPTYGMAPAHHTERQVFHDLFSTLGEGDVFYDVGAHVGLYTVPVASVLPPDSVVAFEPGEGVSELRTALSNHGLRAHVLERAISQETPEVEYYRDHDGKLGSVFDSDGSVSRPETITARELLDGDLPLPTVVKIDVRGAELDVLHGLRDVLEREECRLVYCELHVPVGRRYDNVEEHRENWSFDEVLRTLRQCGFEVELMFVYWDDHLFLRARK